MFVGTARHRDTTQNVSKNNSSAVVQVPSMLSPQSMIVRTVAALLILCLTATASGQQPPALSKHAETVKRKVGQLAPNAHISVITVQGEEQYGSFQSEDNLSFTFLDIDRHENVTLRYEEVQKIKNGYGGVNTLHQKHTDHTKAIIITVVVLGVLGGVIAAAATAKN
jgi:hypothetical protein